MFVGKWYSPIRYSQIINHALRYSFYKSGICGYSTQALFGDAELPYFIFLLFLPFILCALVLLVCPVHMVMVLNKRSNLMWVSTSTT